MPTEVTMPQMSDTMTEGTIVKWLKKEGDKVAAGEVIAEIGRASCREECLSVCRSRWSPYH